MSDSLNRYSHPEIVEYLAVQYAAGDMTPLVRNRMQTLLHSNHYVLLSQTVEQKLTLLNQFDEAVPEVAPDPAVWQQLQNTLGHANKPATHKVRVLPSVKSWMALAASISLFAVLLAFLLPQQSPSSSLSYVAVMTNQADQAALVAATYGETRELTLDLIDLPDVDEDASLELWVTSKTDRQARSLGLIDTQSNVLTRTLTEAEWRLIKDSATLIVTVEEYGGSSIGEPMGDVVAEGLCVRLSAWES